MLWSSLVKVKNDNTYFPMDVHSYIIIDSGWIFRKQEEVTWVIRLREMYMPAHPNAFGWGAGTQRNYRIEGWT